ncbi:hypothetical protein BC832DRAFT_567733 [Gaertneriomyces semiglobifer]|nr:hypothetical protein BC832DRAFT_567733 [Gaertneriomyces semiglobifer]
MSRLQTVIDNHGARQPTFLLAAQLVFTESLVLPVACIYIIHYMVAQSCCLSSNDFSYKVNLFSDFGRSPFRMSPTATLASALGNRNCTIADSISILRVLASVAITALTRLITVPWKKASENPSLQEVFQNQVISLQKLNDARALTPHLSKCWPPAWDSLSHLRESRSAAGPCPQFLRSQ